MSTDPFATGTRDFPVVNRSMSPSETLFSYVENGAVGFCIPPAIPKSVHLLSGITFLVLVKTPGNRIAWCEFTDKLPPGPDQYRKIASAFDSIPLYPEGRVLTEIEQARRNFGFVFLKEDIFDIARWNLRQWEQIELLERALNVQSACRIMEIRAEIKSFVEGYLRDCLHCFRSALNPEAFRHASAGENFSANLYNYLISQQSILQRNRLQAINAYPFLADRILLNSYACIRRTIDSGHILLPALASKFEVPAGVARKLSRYPHRVLTHHLNKPEILWPLFARIAPEKIPETNDDWVEFNLLANKIVATTDQPINTPLNKAILSECLYSRSARRILDASDWNSHRANLLHFTQTLVAVTHHVLLSTYDPKDAELMALAAESALILRLGFARTAKFAFDWDRACREAEDENRDDRIILRRDHWATIRTTRTIIDDYALVPLDCSEKLTREGEWMNHCAGDYSLQCWSGRYQIWSIQSLSGTRIATLRTEVMHDPLIDKYSLIIRELKGQSNLAASDDAQRVANRFTSEISSHEVELRSFAKWCRSVGSNSLNARKNSIKMKVRIAALRKVFGKAFDLASLLSELMGPKVSLDLSRLDIRLAIDEFQHSASG